MNILQIHDLVKFWIDEYQSPRQTDARIDQAIWSAAKSIVEEKYDHSKQNHNLDSVERFQRVRDELYTLIYHTPIGATSIGISNNLIAALEIPDDYKYLLLLEVVALNGGEPDSDTEWIIVDPITLDIKRDWLKRNPYRKPKNDGLFNRNYYEENVNGFTIHTEITSLNWAKLTYLKEPVENFIGIEKSAGYTPSGDVSAISLGDIVYSGNTYTRGDIFTLANGTSHTGDEILISFTNTDLPITLHEEIAKKAAVAILDSVGMYDKATKFKQDLLSK